MEVLRELHENFFTLHFGYYIDFVITKISDSKSKSDIEVSRRAGAINTNSEMGIANEVLNSTVDRLSMSLRGELTNYVAQVNSKSENEDKSLSKVLYFIIGLIVLGVIAWIYTHRR
jgi:hypothetical protein